MRVSLLRRYEELSDSKSWISKELLSSVVTQEELPPISEMKSDAIQLTWESIKYQIKSADKTQNILNGVSGFANPGELTVIMGSSGAGKTSLLNIIAGRIKNQANTKISGLVSANGKPISTIDFKKYCAFVRQEDLLLPFLTVKETLLYAGLLKINKPRNEIDQLVDKLLIDLRLNTVSENKIGNYMYKGISGGERKRVSVGVELISEPQIIILDEPTSGLDSFTAELIIDMLKDLGKQGKTIIATIHQPSSNLFEKFQKLILLSEGNVVYHGSAAKSRKYFTNLGFRCPRLVNPPDYYMRILHITNRYNQTDEESTRLETLIEAYKKIEPKNENPILAELNKVKYESANESKKLMTLIKRQFTNRRRDPTPSRQNFIFYALTSLLADLIYGRLGNDFKALQDIRGVLYFITLIHVMVGNARGSLEFPFERGNFLREKEQGFYNTLVYLSAKMIAEVPLQLATVLLASVLIYFPIGLNLTFEKFCLFYLIALLSNLMGVGIGYCIGALSPNLQTAVQMGPLVLSPLSVYGGFLVNVDKMNVAFRWIQNISPYYWSFKSLCLNQFTDMDFDCNSDGPKCDPLKDLGFDGPLYIPILWMIVHLISTRILAYLILRHIKLK